MTISQRLGRGVLRWLFGHIRRGAVAVAWSDRSVDVLTGAEEGETAVIIIKDEARLLRSLLGKGSLGFGATYIDGTWDSPDLPLLLETASRSIDFRQHGALVRPVLSLGRRVWDLRPHRFWSSPIEEIGVHYDLGNDFYAAWLDSTMTYSSALFSDDDEPLEQAQLRKYARLCELLELESGDRVLEIGSGWGGFAEYAATHHEVEVTGLTLSTEMATFARKRLAAAGLAHRTDIKVQDFRAESGTYDKVVSIEMIESVQASEWPDLFETIGSVLRPGGMMAMQAIVIDDRFHEQLTKRDEFIKTYIFPGGDLPTLGVLRRLADRSGLSWVTASTHGSDYAETLSRWASSFQAAWDGIAADAPTFDERFRRMWQYYLAYCEAGFRNGRLDGVQFSAIRV
ncbi:MAG: class I SAM-dependent methyltransferase [Acidimicrobiia bacterium]